MRSRAIVALVAAALLALVPAAASADPIAGGRTKLQLDSGLFTALRQGGVSIKALKGAKANGRFVGLPVKGGLIDLGTANGFVTHESGFRLATGGRSASLTQLGLDTNKAELRAKVDGQRLRLAAIPHYGYARKGFGDEIEAARLVMTGRAAAALNRKLHLHAFRAGASLGGIATTIRPEWDSAAGGSMQFSLDSGTVEKLKSLGVEPLPFEVAAGSTPFSYSATVLNGAIYPDLKAGGGGIEGGVRIANPSGPSPVVTWSNLAFALEANTLAGSTLVHTEAGQLAPAPGGPIAVLDLSASTARVDPDARTVTISNARATLEASTAALLNETFAKPKGKGAVFAAGDLLGTFSLTLEGR